MAVPLDSSKIYFGMVRIRENATGEQRNIVTGFEFDAQQAADHMKKLTSKIMSPSPIDCCDDHQHQPANTVIETRLMRMNLIETIAEWHADNAAS